MSAVEAEIEVLVRDKDGRIVRHLKQPARSWVANFARELAALLSAKGGAALGTSGVVASASILDQTGSSVSAWTEWYAGATYAGGGTPCACNAPDNDDSYGIIVGRGTTPVSYDDYRLESKIPHGTAAGQLDYDPTTLTDVTVDTAAGTAHFKISRPFKNLSGADITVAEVGLKARSYWKDGGGVRQDLKYLIARDVLKEPVTVPHLGTLNVIYTVKVSL